jgi:hypothetical protein
MLATRRTRLSNFAPQDEIDSLEWTTIKEISLHRKKWHLNGKEILMYYIPN